MKVAIEVLATCERVYSRMTSIINPHRVMIDPQRGAALIQSAYRYHSKLLKDSRWGYNRNRTTLSKDQRQQIISPPFSIHNESFEYIDYELIDEENDLDYIDSDQEDISDLEDLIAKGEKRTRTLTEKMRL